MGAMIGWAFVAVSAGVVILTLPMLKTGAPPLAPSLVPVFGVLFAILYASVQYACAGWLRSRKGIVLITVLLVAWAGLGWFSAAVDFWGYFEKSGASHTRHILVSGACISGLGLGIGLLKGYVRYESQPRR